MVRPSSRGTPTGRAGWSVRSQLAAVIAAGIVGVLGLHAYLHVHVSKGVKSRGNTASAKGGGLPRNDRQSPGASDWDASPSAQAAPTGLRHGTSKNRVYCMVPFVWPHVQPNQHRAIRDALHRNEVKKGSYGPERYKEIMETWGQRCDKIEFFVDRPPGTPLIPNLPHNVISINMTRFLDSSLDHGQDQMSQQAPEKFRYGKHIWEKMWRSWVWVRQHHAKDFEWFVKVDDDCFLFVENIRWYVTARGWSPLDAHYFGHKLYHRASHGVPYTLIAGATVIWSRAALEVAATAYEQMPKFQHHGPERGYCEDRSQASEEVSTARCLLQNGVLAESARDELGREMVLLFHASALMKIMKRPPRGHRDEGWYWKNKPEDVTELDQCCSTRPISFHAMKGVHNLRVMNKFFYNPTATFKDVNRMMNKDNSSLFNSWLLETKGNLTELLALERYGLAPADPVTKRPPPDRYVTVAPRPKPKTSRYTQTNRDGGRDGTAAQFGASLGPGTRYITWKYNQGNLNNQLITVAAAFDTARELNRTVLIRTEETIMVAKKGGMISRAWDKRFLGIEEGLWDMDALRKEYSIVLESEIEAEYGSLAEHPVIGKHLHDSTCVLVESRNHESTITHLKKLDTTCPLLNIGGEGGQVRFKEHDNVHEFFHVFRPARYLVDAAESWLASVNWGTSSGRPHLTVHSRSFWESRRCSNAFEFCAGKVQRELKSRAPKYTAHHEVAATMCFVTPEAVNLVLDRSKLGAHRVVNCSASATGCQPWFLASDRQSAEIIENKAEAFGALQFDPSHIKRQQYREGRVNNMLWKQLIQRLELSYLDLYLLSRGEVFLGNVYSTFSSSVCKMRARGEPSNVCRLLTTSTPDPFIESLATTGLPAGWRLPWVGNTAESRAVVAKANTKRGNIPCV